ncbi:MAG: hypothetical protein ABI978_03890 [Chloroflexota bacterium]
MRRPVVLSFAVASILAVVVAGTAFASHCNVANKPDGAGQKLVVLINPVTGAPTFIGTNAAGRLIGGFADVYIDADLSGTLTAADVQVENDVFVIANHSGKFNPAQGAPAVLPPINAGNDPGGPGKGVDG